MADLQINVARYIEDKAAGICKLVKLNGQLFFTAKEFDRAGKVVVVNAPIAVESLKDVVANLDREIAEKVAAKTAAEQMIADAAIAPEMLV